MIIHCSCWLVPNCHLQLIHDRIIIMSSLNMSVFSCTHYLLLVVMQWLCNGYIMVIILQALLYHTAVFYQFMIFHTTPHIRN